MAGDSRGREGCPFCTQTTLASALLSCLLYFLDEPYWGGAGLPQTDCFIVASMLPASSTASCISSSASFSSSTVGRFIAAYVSSGQKKSPIPIFVGCHPAKPNPLHPTLFLHDALKQNGQYKHFPIPLQVKNIGTPNSTAAPVVFWPKLREIAKL